jgi:hypothetical protein
MRMYADMWADQHARVSPLPAPQGGNKRALREQVREAFRRNKDEIDPVKIQEQKDA